MRKATTLLAIVASVLFFAFAFLTVASADPGGNNGDVKIHDTTTAVADHRNEPHVCSFYIDGFNFDGGSSGTWRIERWAPTGSGVQTGGTWGPADSKGNWHSITMTLPDGHYKLFFEQTGAPGGEKQKVFWVECTASAPASNATPTPTPTSHPTGTAGGTGGTGNTATPTPTVAGFQQNNAPSGAVTPIVELPGGSQHAPNTNTQGNAVIGVQTAPGTVNGVQTAPVAGLAGLPSTSTNGSPALPIALFGLALVALGGAVLRRA